jgi:hypothetical protein
MSQWYPFLLKPRSFMRLKWFFLNPLQSDNQEIFIKFFTRLRYVEMHNFMGMHAHKIVHLLFQTWKRYELNVFISYCYNWGRRRAIFVVSERDCPFFLYCFTAHSLRSFEARRSRRCVYFPSPLRGRRWENPQQLTLRKRHKFSVFFVPLW